MKNRIYGVVVLLLLSACGGGQSSDGTDTDGQQTEAVTWKSKFPSLWSVAYAADINPEDVTYDQFINTLAEKLKADTAFTNSVKGDAGVQGIVGPAGPQGTGGSAGLDGTDGTDGADAALSDWETMYSFSTGDSFFYTCNSNSPCTADDLTFHQVYVNSTTNPYYVATLIAGGVSGTDLINTGATMTNLRASTNCEYKAQTFLTLSSYPEDPDKELIPSKMGSGNVYFNYKGTFTGEFDIVIGDASGGGPRPALIVSTRLPYSFAATQSEKDRIAHEFNNVGTGLFSRMVLKRRCPQP